MYCNKSLVVDQTKNKTFSYYKERTPKGNLFIQLMLDIKDYSGTVISSWQGSM